MHTCKCFTASVAFAMVLLTMSESSAQTPVQAGGGSYASAPPFYKAKTEANGPGFNATAMLSREIFVDELPPAGNGEIDVPGRPIPTNDWWTDLINNRFSGALWSYPAMLKTSEDGVQVFWPTYWADAGKEIKSRTSITVSASRFRASAAIAADWHDWDVVFRMPAASGDGSIRVTSVHGSLFTWFEFTDAVPEVRVGASASLFGESNGRVGVIVDGDRYGFYFPEGSGCSLADGRLSFSGEPSWLSVALLRSESDLAAFAPYAASVPRDTKVAWTYDEPSASVNTSWSVTAENLRDSSASAPVLQGFLPHAYKYALPGASFDFIDSEGFSTPRGRMKLAVSPSGEFSYSYRFSGMIPAYGAPREGNAEVNGFRSEVMETLMAEYAAKGSFGGDTYWGGKGLVQMAMNMSFAKETGNEKIYAESKRRLREAFENWLTYTPGEDTFFFSYYPRWGAMLGFDVSYDSDAFNDHHFHYGYFTYAAALLCMEDRDFAGKYGEILTMIAKDYANWDRSDSRFPFMRTLDPWCGHSWAGGLGDHGNDNGNGQESTSEAMQAWGGLYLLGVALGDRGMRDAGIWGWNTEARATREYWFDVDAPRPANAGGRKAWPGKGGKEGNYNYAEYPYAYNSNITGKGIGWWTWFGGDPLFMHGIQWMPVSPALDYLSWDPDFVGWAFDDMMRGANSTFSHDWFETTHNTDNGEAIDPLANNDWGNVALAYLQRHDPAEAARIFDEALERKLHIATSVSTSHISYYVTHSHLTYGAPDFSIHADMPTAQVRVKNGVATYFVYNPSDEDRTVRFFDASGAFVKTVNAPARRLAAISADPVASSIEVSVAGGPIVPPGEEAALSIRVLDQYCAGLAGASPEISLSPEAPATVSAGVLKVNASAVRGSKFSMTVSSGALSRVIEITVNDRPVAESAQIDGLPEICEKNVPMSCTLAVTDQYGNQMAPTDTEWTLIARDGTEKSVKMPLTVSKAGMYTIRARSASAGAEASADVFVTPPMPLVSRGCAVAASSAENGGTLPAGAVDGDEQVRWGSRHTDSEWLVLDLGEECLVSRIDILWEAAFASKYDIQLAPDGAALETMTVDYGGQQTQITVPAENAWTTALSETASGAGHRASVINASGRYIRIKGVERGSAYGYSIYEINVYGLRSSLPADAPLGVEFSLPETMDSGETVVLEPVAFTRDGEELPGAKVVWSADREARFDGNAFTPLSHGRYTVSAALEGVGSSEGTVFVNDVERPASVSLDKEAYVAIQGVPVSVPFRVMNQFLAPYTGNPDDMDIILLGPGGETSENATYDRSTQSFVSTECGTHHIDFGGLALCAVDVRPIGEVNLALGKTAWDSSHENDGLTASFAVDGRQDTRWGSTFNDEEWMVVDLGNAYLLDKVLIYWNNPAYATHYTVSVSRTGYDDDFETVETRSGYRYSPEADVISCDGREARYVRLQGHKRSTGYGTSVNELEVYGSGFVSGIGQIAEDTSAEARWYTVQGFPVAAPSTPGIYIRVTGGKASKIIVR